MAFPNDDNERPIRFLYDIGRSVGVSSRGEYAVMDTCHAENDHPVYLTKNEDGTIRYIESIRVPEGVSPFSVARYGILRSRDGNGDQYGCIHVRTTEPWENMFTNSVLHQEFDNGVISEETLMDGVGLEDIVTAGGPSYEPVYIWVLDEGPNGQMALNGGAYRIWELEQFSWPQVLLISCGQWNIFTDPKLLEMAIAEKFSDM